MTRNALFSSAIAFAFLYGACSSQPPKELSPDDGGVGSGGAGTGGSGSGGLGAGGSGAGGSGAGGAGGRGTGGSGSGGRGTGGIGTGGSGSGGRGTGGIGTGGSGSGGRGTGGIGTGGSGSGGRGTGGIGTGGSGAGGVGTGGAGPLPTLPSASGPGTFKIPGRTEDAIQVVVPGHLDKERPLVISFHPSAGTESEGITQFNLEENAATYQFVAIAPRAGNRGAHPADVDHEQDGGGSSWNMWSVDPDANEDLRYVTALIAAARRTYGIDTSRVYTMGFSNGAFFAYFVAATLPSQIAGFAENSGGWTSDSCPTRYGADSDGTSFYPTSAPSGIGTGTSFSCSVLFNNPSFPSKCRTTATNHLRPPALGSRVPFGYIAHYSSDSIVSVMWSCILGEALGNRVQTAIRWADPDVWGGAGSVIKDHSVMPDFFGAAWVFFNGRTTAD